MSKLIKIWKHHNLNKEVIGEIRRFQNEDGSKEDIPYYTKSGDYFEKGIPESLKKKPYPLFGADTLRNPSDFVFIVEGQKCQQVLESLGFQAVTSILGANNAGKSDWLVLKDYQMVLLPDNDQVGEKYIKSVYSVLSPHNPQKEIKVLRLPNLPNKGDICDWLKALSYLKDWDEYSSLENHPNKEEIRKSFLEAVNQYSTTVPEEWNKEIEIEWEAPIPFGSAKTPTIPVSLLPTPLIDYAEALVKSTQTPPGMTVMMMYSVIAACLQKKADVSPEHDSYIEPINLWTITALPPASRKSAIVSALTEPLNQWESRQASALESRIKENATQREIINKRCDRLSVDASKENDITKRSKIIDELNALKNSLPEEIILPRLWTGDVTPEQLQNLLVEQNEKMAVISDEGGIFEVMSGLYSDGKSNLDVFLQAHAGQAARVDRGKRKAHLKNPALTFGLAVQPVILTSMAYGSKQKFRGKGLLARFLYCIPESNIGYRDGKNVILS